MVNKKKRLIIIDSNALVHRAYHALPPLVTKKGELVNAVYGFLLVFLKAVKELKPDFVAATFDLAAPTFRHEKYKEYKAKRIKAPDELYHQIPRIKEILTAFNIPIFEKEGFEADDLIGTVARLIQKKQVFPKIETIIITGDLDALQLIDENTKVFILRKGVKDTIIYDEQAVINRFGLKPGQLSDFKALRGDPSDNIPGVAGIGEKTAAALIKEFGTLDNLYGNLKKQTEKARTLKTKLREKLLMNQEIAFFSRKLVTIKKDAPIDFQVEDCRFGDYNRGKITKLFKELDFYSLIAKLPQSNSEFVGGSERKSLENSALKEIERLRKEGVFSKRIYELEKSLIPVIGVMEKNGIKTDTDFLGKLSKRLAFKIKDLELRIYKLAGHDFNINSPKQLSEVLFKKLNLPFSGLKKTPGGVVSTSSSELKKLEDKHPIISLIQEYRELTKLKTGFVDALPKMVNPKDGRIHPCFHQLGTVTGRLSCSNPNLQNVPIRGEWGKEIRKAFIAEEGYRLISCDYSQMELRVVAHIAQDKKMLKAFEEGKDIHKLTAAEINNVSLEQVTPKMRYQAKTLNFGLIYGMSIRAFAEGAGIPFDRAKKFVQEYLKDFQGVANYIEKTKQEARENGYVETLFGRKRFIPEINSQDFRLQSAAERMAVNMPVQGSSADIMKMAMLKVNEYLSQFNNRCKLILQIHDELLFEVGEADTERFIKGAKKTMEGVVGLAAPLKVDVKIGSSWGELE